MMEETTYEVREKKGAHLYSAKREHSYLGTEGFRVFCANGQSCWYSTTDLLRKFYFTNNND
jgi:hypothetical protein